MGGIGQEFVLERAALLRILSQEHMIGQYSIWKGRHWLELFLKRAAMVTLLYEVGLIGQCSFWRGRDWSGFFWEKVGRSEFLWELLGSGFRKTSLL